MKASRTLLIALPVSVAIALSTLSSAYAANEFQAGRIIDDAVFTNTSSMSTGQIQDFLNSKVPTCDTNGQQNSEFGGPDLNGDGRVQRWEWGKANYNQTSFPCLRDYKVADGRMAAQVIYDTAQKYTISPQVLIVLLQKEQGLVTDTWPLDIQYRSATGYGCPDTAPCDSQYYGLVNQLDWAANMFRSILNNSPNWYTPYVMGDNYIQYNPNANCGGSIVNIQNRSTQALYNYTPYQPNSEALAAPMGAAVNCGAYGNLNFFRYFNSWFGSTYTASYHWGPSQQNMYTDTSKTINVASDSFVENESRRVFLTVKVLNDGYVTWNQGKIFLGTSGPNDRTSAIHDSSWPSTNRAATITELSVAPGEYATFNFWANTPAKPGTYKEYFNLVAEGITWMNDMGLYYQFTVQPARFDWTVVEQNAYTDSTRQKTQDLSKIVAGNRVYFYTRVLNTGNQTWRQSNVYLATNTPRDRQSTLYDNSWLSANRAAKLNELSVAPGEYGTFGFWITPTRTGSFKEHFNLVAEGSSWFTDIGYYYPLTVNKPVYSWENSIQTAYTDNTLSTPVDLTNISPGQRFYLYMRIQNTGNTSWTHGTLNLATNNPRDRSSLYYDSSWLSTNRLTTVNEATVEPGQSGTFGVWVTAPQQTGNYKEYLNFVFEGSSWLNDIGLYYPVTVR